ncbi:hypothetical protein Ciccas_014356, partial [Cichlidogyrus casuarinus]
HISLDLLEGEAISRLLVPWHNLGQFAWSLEKIKNLFVSAFPGKVAQPLIKNLHIFDFGLQRFQPLLRIEQIKNRSIICLASQENISNIPLNVRVLRLVQQCLEPQPRRPTLQEFFQYALVQTSAELPAGSISGHTFFRLAPGANGSIRMATSPPVTSRLVQVTKPGHFHEAGSQCTCPAEAQ